MNAQRMYKEARPLFWPWCAVVCAGALPLLYPHYPSGEISRVGFLLGMSLLAALPFGNEFQSRTFSLLLSQPISRMKIWREKLSVTAIVVFTAALACFLSWFAIGIQGGPIFWGYAAGAAVALVASAPFWTLFTRSIVGGLVLSFGFYNLTTLLGNVAFVGVTGASKLPARTFIATMSCVLLLYTVLMLWLGWRKLARFQVTGAAAGDDLLTAGPNVMPGSLVSPFRCRPTGAVRNLIRKEFRLLRPVWLLSLFAALGWACMTALRVLDHRGLTRVFEVTVVSVAVLSTLIIAVLAGSLSLGEERTSGTQVWHLALPVSARVQWFVKLCMALFAGFIGAWLLPVLIAGRSLLKSSNFWDGKHFVSIFLIAVLLLAFAAFWCACALKGTVPAVLLVVPMLIAIYLAGKLGEWAGLALARRFFVWFDPFANANLAHDVSRFGFNALFRLINAASDDMTDSVQAGLVLTTIILVPTLLYALIQSYRLFRAQPQDRTWSVIRSLTPLVVVAFLCNFALQAFYFAVGRATQNPKYPAFFETIQAIQKIQLRATKLDAAHPLQLTIEDLAKASPLSKSTRRLLGNSHITLSLDEPPHQSYFGCTENPRPHGLFALGYPWYSATIPLADGSHFAVAFDTTTHYIISAGICK